jgi:hypothetical protein
MNVLNNKTEKSLKYHCPILDCKYHNSLKSYQDPMLQLMLPEQQVTKKEKGFMTLTPDLQTPVQFAMSYSLVQGPIL